MKWPGMDKIRDSADILQPEKEETYQFIEKLLSAVKESFSTNRVHLGMDEAVMLGLGNYLKENGYKKGSLIIREHCNRVVDICRKLELKPMIWSDMYITANSTGGYYDLPENTDCSKWEKPKKDLGLVYWDYYHDDTRTYEKCWISMRSFRITLFLQEVLGFGMEFPPIILRPMRVPKQLFLLVKNTI